MSENEPDGVALVGGGDVEVKSWDEFAEKAVRSQQEPVESDDAVGDWYEPPYAPKQLAKLPERSTTHAACAQAKAQGVAGYGFNLAPVDEIDDGEEPGGRETLEEFWRGGDFQLGPENKPASASDVLENGWFDYETVGWLAVEILVNPLTGKPTGLAHVPAHTIRTRQDGPGYVQIDGTSVVQYYGEAGDRYAPDGDDDQTFVDAETGEAVDSTSKIDTVANELLVIRNYSALAPHYGTPDIIPALPTIAANLAAREYNLNFFENDGVPRFAMMIEGGELNDRAYNQIEEQLKDLKKNENAHRGMLVEAIDAANGPPGETGNVSVSIEPLTVGVEEDASFIEFRKENEHDILKVHSVPPVVANRTEGSNYSNSREQRQEFAQTTVRPRQETLADRLYQILHVQAFEIPEWTVEFELHGGQNKQRQAEINKTRTEGSAGVYKVNEAREEWGLEPIVDDSGEPLPQGEMLLAELQGSNSSSSSSGPGEDGDGEEIDEEDVEQAERDARAASSGYSITARTDGGE